LCVGKGKGREEEYTSTLEWQTKGVSEGAEQRPGGGDWIFFSRIRS
jgi:hypothetical protein